MPYRVRLLCFHRLYVLAEREERTYHRPDCSLEAVSIVLCMHGSPRDGGVPGSDGPGAESRAKDSSDLQITGQSALLELAEGHGFAETQSTEHDREPVPRGAAAAAFFL